MTETQTIYFSFTLNNYTIDDLVKIKNFSKKYCYRAMFGKEEAPTTGTKHLQGCFQLLERTRLTTLKNIINIKEIHLETQKKCYLANARYCQKSGDSWFWPDKQTNFENGKPITKKNEKYERAINLAKKGDFDLIDPEIFLKYENKLNKIYVENLETENLLLKNKHGNFFQDFFILIWGPTGTGKSHLLEDLVYCLEHFYEKYCKSHKIDYKPLKVYHKKSNKWWDGYKGEKIVIIEELEPQWVRISGNLLKQLCDQYPFPVEAKGTTINKIRPYFVLMTSNYNLKNLCSRDDGTTITENYDPLNRRLYQVQLTKLGNFIEWPRFDRLTLYFDTHESVKIEREKLKEKRRLELEHIAEERNGSCSSTAATNGSPDYYYSEDFQTKDKNYFETILNEYESSQSGSESEVESVITVNYCKFNFDFKKLDDFQTLNLYKKIILGLKSLMKVHSKRINNLKKDLNILNEQLENLKTCYNFLNEFTIGKKTEDFYNSYLEKAEALSNTILLIKNKENEIKDIKDEILIYENKYFDCIFDIEDYEEKIDKLIVKTNKIHTTTVNQSDLHVTN